MGDVMTARLTPCALATMLLVLAAVPALAGEPGPGPAPAPAPVHPPAGPPECACPAEPAPAAEPEMFWGDLEYLLWSVKGSFLPPLVTTSPPGTVRSQAGVPGTAGVSVV